MSLTFSIRNFSCASSFSISSSISTLSPSNPSTNSRPSSASSKTSSNSSIAPSMSPVSSRVFTSSIPCFASSKTSPTASRTWAETPRLPRTFVILSSILSSRSSVSVRNFFAFSIVLTSFSSWMSCMASSSRCRALVMRSLASRIPPSSSISSAVTSFLRASSMRASTSDTSRPFLSNSREV